MTDKKTCFVIAPIGEPDSDERKRSDNILNYLIKPAIQEFGYIPIRADQISKPGIITTQVVQHILDDPLVIADLTNRNPNVFYELAIRHVIRKPLVQIIEKDQEIPFDVSVTRTVFVDHRDLDSVAKAKDEIKQQIKSVEEDPSKIDTPISVAIDSKYLKQSGEVVERILGNLVSEVANLQMIMQVTEKKVNVLAAVLKPQLKDINPEAEDSLLQLVALKLQQGLLQWFKSYKEGIKRDTEDQTTQKDDQKT